MPRPILPLRARGRQLDEQEKAAGLTPPSVPQTKTSTPINVPQRTMTQAEFSGYDKPRAPKK